MCTTLTRAGSGDGLGDPTSKTMTDENDVHALSLEPSIDWETERESALAVTIHPCCQFDFVWLNLLLNI